ncbi:patatin-like phospholipase family protein [Aquimarina hainanensis]|uniref:Patatin-like phospholipase family protein n=1 Tax=Aquimarina hainanensis TaxID=1578017 RepID=A0ABW5N1D5_9FLAO|nr:patatin-like phospholipase family protein [Aquimarina sp. TRL1]QKX04553.1 patatin-like phospholipase family protein [Aquimarina sp. TRL1]
MSLLKTTLSALIWIVLLVVPFLSFSQEDLSLNIPNDSTQTENDLKVGVVLSGGGAKGLAHIGALKIIEDAGIRIDYIGGTSMGAIVGSLYAAGYNAKELDSIFRSVDFDMLIQDNIPREAKTFYEKEDAEKYAISLPFDRFKIGLPKSLSKGQNLYNQFAQLTSHVSHITDFDKLPVPFFCMAANLETGEQVLLDKGYLPDAVSASGALPSVYDPVELNGILMTDGGVANNYPIKEIKKKGAQVVIGVDVQDSLMSRKNLNSVANIMLQISNFRTIKDMKGKVSSTDIYIKPDVQQFSILSFDQRDAIIANGEKAALRKLEQLKQIKQQQRRKKKPSISIPKGTDSLRIENLAITGNKQYTRAYIKGKLKLKTPSTTTFNKLNQGFNNLSATGNFDRINHKLTDNTLSLDLKESENKMLLRFAVHYDNLYKTAALINVTRKKILFNNDVLSFDLALGDNIRYNLDYYIDNGFYWSVGIKHRFNTLKKTVPFDFIKEYTDISGIGINTVDIDYTDFNTQVYAETLLNQNLSLGIGGEAKRLVIVSETIGTDENQLPRTVFDNTNYWSLFSYLKLDTYNNKYFPSKGLLFDSDIHTYLFVSDVDFLFLKDFKPYSILKSKFGYATPLFSKLSMNVQVEAGSFIGSTDISSLDFALGGFGAQTINNLIPLYGYDYISFTTKSFLKGLLTLDYEFAKKNHLNFSVNAANVGDKIFSSAKEVFSLPIDYSGFAIGYGIDTFAGPVQVKHSYSPELKESQWYFSVGFWF